MYIFWEFGLIYQIDWIKHFTHHRDGIHDFLGGGGEVNALGVGKVRTLELAEHRAASGGRGFALPRSRQTRHAAEVYGLRICQRARSVGYGYLGAKYSGVDIFG